MSYQEELQARLDAVHRNHDDARRVVNVDTLKQQLMQEVEDNLDDARFDLTHEDLLRYFKIERLTKQFAPLFSKPDVLRLFYIIAYVDGISLKELQRYDIMPLPAFKEALRNMIQSELIELVDNELCLTLEGEGFASRIGLERY